MMYYVNLSGKNMYASSKKNNNRSKNVYINIAYGIPHVAQYSNRPR